MAARDTGTRPAQVFAGDSLGNGKLIKYVPALYPPEARAGHVQGLVRLRGLISKDGSVKELTVVKGHPLLIPAALAAARRWIYQPVLINGQPVEVYTSIVIDFTLNQ